MSRGLDLTFHTQRRDGVECLRIQLGTCLVGVIICDPEYRQRPWGVSLYLPGAVDPPRFNLMRDAQLAAKQTIEDWLVKAHLR